MPSDLKDLRAPADRIHPDIWQRMNDLGIAGLREIGRRVGVAGTTVGRALSGDNTMSLALAIRIAEVLEWSVDELAQRIQFLKRYSK
jgi:DNA-binding XRE family transcriptional regulator